MMEPQKKQAILFGGTVSSLATALLREGTVR